MQAGILSGFYERASRSVSMALSSIIGSSGIDEAPAASSGLSRQAVRQVSEPRQAAVDPAGLAEPLVVGHLCQQPFDVGALIEPVELHRDDDRVGSSRRALAPGSIVEQPVLASTCFSA